jgi:NTP pyrophosphatase (non-canonical NTP hydrolase)
MSETTPDLNKLIERLRQFADERDWNQFHSPMYLAMAVFVEAGELVEHFQWLTESESRALPVEKLKAVEYEIADVFIYLLRLSDLLNVDIVDAAARKIELNARKYPVDKVVGKSKKYTEYD